MTSSERTGRCCGAGASAYEALPRHELFEAVRSDAHLSFDARSLLSYTQSTRIYTAISVAAAPEWQAGG
jgi:hypothetical protein